MSRGVIRGEAQSNVEQGQYRVGFQLPAAKANRGLLRFRIAKNATRGTKPPNALTPEVFKCLGGSGHCTNKRVSD